MTEKYRRGLAATLVAVIACLCLAGCSRKSQLERRASGGRRHFQDGQYEEAIIEYTNVLKLDKLNGEAIHALGLSYYALGDFRRALPFLAKAAELDPKDAEIRIALGRVYAAGGRVGEARGQAVACLGADPANLDALRLLIDASRGTTELAEALRLATALATPLEANAAHHVIVGNLHLRRGDVEAAAGAFAKAAKIDSDAAEAHLGLARVADNKGERAAAATAYERAAALSPKASAAVVALADFKARNDDAAGARQILQEAVKETPDYVAAWHALARLAFNDKDYETCHGHALRVLAKQPGNVQALLLKADSDMARGDTDQAIAVYEGLAGRFPAARDLRHALARALLWKRNPQRAIALLSKALEGDPGDIEAALLLARAHLHVGNLTSAGDTLGPLMQKDPPVAAAFTVLAAAHLEDNRSDEAVVLLRRMATRLPKLPEAHYMLGRAYLAAGNTTGARNAFGEAIRLNPDDIEALAKLTVMDLGAGQSEQALSRVKGQIAQRSDSARLYYLLGRVLHHREDLQAAEAALLKAAELAPSLPGPYVLLTQVYQAQNKLEAALAKLEEALVLRPRDVAMRMLAASLYAQKGSITRATKLYEELLALQPGFAPAANELACLYERQDRIEEAARLVRQAREALPGDPYIADTLGWILCRKGDYPWALTLLKESAAQAPDRPDIRYHLGVTQCRLGDEANARQSLEKALSGSRTFDGAKEAERLLAVLMIDPRTIDQGSEQGRQALKTLKQTLEAMPAEPAALVRLAIVQEKAQQWKEAATLYEKVLAASPTHRGAVQRLATLYAERLDNPDRAMALAKQAREQAPRDPRAAAELAWLAYQRGDAKWALSLLQDSAGKLTDDPRVQYRLGLVLFMNGRTDSAREAVSRALEVGKDFPDAPRAKRFLQLVDIIKTADTNESALACIREALQDAPDDAAALLASATILDKTVQKTKAIATYRRIVDGHAGFAPGLVGLASLLAGDSTTLGEAEALAREARALLPGDPEVARVLGTIQHKRGKHEWAASLLRERVTAGNASADTLYRLGACEEKLGNSDAAKRYLNQALKQDPAFAEAQDARRILAGLQ